MQLYPTRSTFEVAVAAAGLITLGTAARLPPVAAFGGAMLIAIAIGRAIAGLGVTRLRAAGFEMLWSGGTRLHRVNRGVQVVLGCEVINRSRQSVRINGPHALASSMLETAVDPVALDLAPGTRARIDVKVRGRRVGRWGIHGLAVQVTPTPLGAHGMYEVPLVFASPIGFDILPVARRASPPWLRAEGARFAGDLGRRGRCRGDADELRELRDHVPGDPMKRVAWKASARRGRLLVREMERPDPGVFWLVVDASIELWAGRLGSAPLDRVVDEVATLSKHLLQSGSRVGLAVTAARLRSWIAPRSRASQSSRITDALLRASSAVDVDRSALGEPEVASLVAEHARPLEASPSRPVSADNLDALAARVEKLRARAPFPAEVPFAPTLRERSLRQHLTAFGIESPPRSSGEQAAADLTLGWALQEIAIGRPRPTVVHVWAPAPRSAQAVIRGLSVLRKKHVQIRWTLPPLEGFDVGGDPDAPGVILAAEVARMRARSARSRGEQALRRLGLRVGETRG